MTGEGAKVTQARDVLKIVVVGHVDHGKSTVIGRLLYDTHSLPEGAIEKVKRISKEKGKPFEYAYLLDAFEEEQKQGITIDTTQLQFQTELRDYVIIDAPGHKEFLKNMISGAANAEAALLVIDANEGIQEQSKRHGYLLSLLGIQKVYVLVNKMDLISYSEDVFQKIKEEMSEFLGALQVYPLKYIPISAFHGENIASASVKMPWYTGEAVLAALDGFEKSDEPTQAALRFPIQDVYKFDHRRIIAGRIEAGTLRVGDEIIISPGGKRTRVKSIEGWSEKPRQEVMAGMSVGITVEDEFFNQRGEVISFAEKKPFVADTFQANLFWMGQQPLHKEHPYKLKLGTQEVECQIQAINKVIDATTLGHVENVLQVNANDVAEVIIRTKQAVCFDEFRNNAATGRFVLVDGYDVSGGGIISGKVKGLQTHTRFVKENLVVQASLFDEYYYVLEEEGVRRFTSASHSFGLGEAVPLFGQTYAYPEDLNLLDAATKLVVKIRKGRVQDVAVGADFAYDGLPLIDAKGALWRVNSPDDFRKLREELLLWMDSAYNEKAALANRWLHFNAFRQLKYLGTGKAEKIEYQI